MRVRDPREPSGWRNEGPSSAVTPVGYGGSTGGFAQTGAIANGRCPVCGERLLERANQRTCIKVGGEASWAAMRKRGRGGFRFGSNLDAADAAALLSVLD